MSYQKTKLMNLEDGQLLLSAIDQNTKKEFAERADNLYTFKDAAPGPIVTVDDAVAEAVKTMQIEIAPVQDLHGQSNPWPGGSGDNLLPMPITSGSYAYTTTVTVNDDLSFYITKTNGSGWANFVLADELLLKAGSYKIIENDDSSQNAQVVIVNADDSSAIANTRYNSSVIFTLEQDTTVKITYGRSATGTNVLTKLMLFADTTKTSADYVSYSNICPISGWTGANVTRTGRNLFDIRKIIWVSSISGNSFTKPGGAYNLDIYVGSGGIATPVPVSKVQDCLWLKAGTYTITYQSTVSTYFHIMTVAEDGTVTKLTDLLSGGYFTLPNDTYISIRVDVSVETVISNLQIEPGTTASAYEPYQGNTYQIDFPTSAGTVYGGTLTVNADGTGTLVVDSVKETYDENSGISYAAGSQGYPSYFTKKVSSNYSRIITCNTFQKAFINWDNYNNGIRLTNSYFRVRFTPLFDTLEEFNAWIASNNIEVLYELTTPQVYTLSTHQVETITGLNHVWADCGDILSFLYAVDRKADQSGTYEDLTAGNALFLLSDRGETDTEPYAFRKTGGAKNAYGREMLKKIVGGTVAWNQIAMFTSAKVPTAGHDITYTSVDNKAVKINGTASAIEDRTGWFNISESTIHYGHKYLFAVKKLGGSYTGTVKVSLLGSSLMAVDDSAIIVTCPNSGGQAINYRHRMYIDSGAVCNNLVITFICVDLTQMFGSTIADAIDAMEQATAGSGVAWFRSLFPKSYYAYDAGTLMSVNAESHALTGFNQWDGEYTAKTWLSDYTTGATAAQYGYNLTSYIHVIPGTVYYKTATNSSRYGFYDANKNYIPQNSWGNSSATTLTTPNNAHYARFTLTDMDLSTFCINISDTAKNGTYEPYQLRSYPLANVELRGITKWVDGQLVFDGDEYTPDGTVKRRYGIVDLGTLTWTKANNCNNSFTTQNVLKPDANDNIICSAYRFSGIRGSDATLPTIEQNYDDVIVTYTGSNRVTIIDASYSDAATFKTAMSGVYLVYELATPTTETADPYRELQISNRNGTEEFIDRAEEAGTRDVAIPVGTETFYPKSIWDYVDEKVAELQALILES